MNPARLAGALMVQGTTSDAGSPAEVNLRERDVANMGFAEAVDCPVILVADIDRGGVFAHFLGTLECLSASERQRVRGFVINRFRGDIGLLQPGVEWLERKTGKPVFGVIPYLPGLHLDAEDAIKTEQGEKTDGERLRVSAPYSSAENAFRLKESQNTTRVFYSTRRAEHTPCVNNKVRRRPGR